MAVTALFVAVALDVVVAAAPPTTPPATPPATPPTAPVPAAPHAPAHGTPLVVEVVDVPLPTPRALDATRVDAGRKVYAARCQGCHGPTGAGDGPVGRMLKPAPQRFSDALWQARVTDDELRQAIVLGGAAVKKSPSMPPAKDLQPDAVDAVIAFVRSLRAAHGTASVTVVKPDGHDVVVNADASADHRARIVVPGVSGPVTVLGVVDVGGAPACTVELAEAAGARVACTPAKKP